MEKGREVSLDFGFVRSSRSEDLAVQFHRIDALIARDQDITVLYSIGERFHPKTGDWIGLFQLSKYNRNKHLYVGFCWARKHSQYKNRPLERSVDFKISEIKIQNLGKDSYYQFVYVTSSEKLIGCSNEFQIRLYVPINVHTQMELPTLAEQKQTDQPNTVVPYEFFHQPNTLLHLENVTVHLCYEDLATMRCMLNLPKYPVSHHFATTLDLRDWSQLSFPVPRTLSGSCSSCQTANAVIRSLCRRLYIRKLDERDSRTCSQREIETLRNEVNRLKSRERDLEAALSTERHANWSLLQSQNQLKQEIFTNFGIITSWLLKQQPVAQKLTGAKNWTSQIANNEKENQKSHPVHINQKQGSAYRGAHGTDKSSDAVPRLGGKQPPQAKRNEELSIKLTQNSDTEKHTSEHEVRTTLNQDKGFPHRETYSGSRIALNRLFNERDLGTNGKDKVLKNYSGSSISLRRLFADRVPNTASKDKSGVAFNQYSGSNLTLRHLFDERYQAKKKKVPTATLR